MNPKIVIFVTFFKGVAKASVIRGAKVQKAHTLAQRHARVYTLAHIQIRLLGAPDGSILKLTTAEVTQTPKGLIM